MTTGMHTVRDIRCDKCRTVLGWKYVSGVCHGWEGWGETGWQRIDADLSFRSTCMTSFDDDQDRAYVATEKYKEGKFILEKNLMADVQ